ncbi:MAG: hypothetical protein GWO20_17105 [Candidatus Korarchaeota archaeon]|nr:hypothetical protein [Candidatus Korarchaeota archaeon]NIU85577.1 hypothetical protein [Candidatus Thorarchaeota archaeon]NIW15121.1 hypothetical protein [Candidatus Thorarchaeota archaeon]NIW53126.1 hypothetical protein [Candidatus Korarchaeota archaeon]
MPHTTIRIPKDLKNAMDKHKEINWSEVARQAIRSYLRTLEIAEKIASKSKLTQEDAKELSEKIKQKIAEHYKE